MSTSAGSGLLHAFLLDGTGGATRLDWDGVRRWTERDGTLWIVLDYTAPDAAQWLATESRIDPLLREALVENDPRPRAIAHADDLFLIVRGINQNQDATPEDMISLRIWVEARRVITMRHRMSRSLESLVSDLGRSVGPRTSADVAAMLVERVVDHVTTRVDLLGDAISAGEDEVLTQTRGELRAQLADHRRRAIALRRFLAPQRDALLKLAQVAVPWFSVDHRSRVAEAANQMARTIEELEAARERAAVTQEELASRLSEMTNQRLYVLSIITAVFLPLGFVCALLGVNIGGIPFRNDDWAFWVLVAMFGIGVAFQIWLFKRKGWFG
ncbi:MAG: zinc transporter ZntB [Deltaproteobacteria bacterium]|nr:zinc transporter ZntB [Deltaproteobacteria bacterium]